jgi:hypothetical protein
VCIDGRALLDTIRERVRKHCAEAAQTDDLTALMLRWKSKDAGSPPARG